MIGSKISFVFMLVLVHLPFLIMNLERAVSGADPHAIHGVASIVLVLLLLFSGFVMGYTNQTFYPAGSRLIGSSACSSWSSATC